MSPELLIFIEHLINGLTLGALYALVTLGLVLTFGVIDLVNFAHGDMFMIAGYTFYVLLNLEVKLPYLVIAILVIIITSIYAIIIERVAIDRIITKSWRTHAVTTMGISIILQSLALLIFSSDPRTTPTSLSYKFLEIGSFSISYQRLLILVMVVVVFVGIQWFVKYTKFGKTMRATSQNRELCQVFGIDVHKVALITFAIGGGITGLAAVLIAPLFSVAPGMGSMLTLKALAAIVMGGMGQVNGAFYSGFILGIVEALFGGYVNFALKDAVSFGIFVLVLFLKPRGLFGKRIGL